MTSILFCNLDGHGRVGQFVSSGTSVSSGGATWGGPVSCGPVSCGPPGYNCSRSDLQVSQLPTTPPWIG